MGPARAYHHPQLRPDLGRVRGRSASSIHFHSGAAPIEDYFGPIPPQPGQPVLPGAMGIYITEVVWWTCGRSRS